MKKATVAQLKHGLSRYLAHVKRGGTVLVYEQDRPVARLDDLERRGMIRRGTGDMRQWLRRVRPVRVRGY